MEKRGITKRTIKNTLSVTFENYQGKTFTRSGQEIERSIRDLKKRVAAVGLAAGITLGAVAPTVISSLANYANTNKSTREAIEWVNKMEKVGKNHRFQENSAQEEQEEAVKRAELYSAIITYKQLNYKEEKSFKEEKDYINACQKIIESKDFVMDIYTNSIKGKVARAYGITDPAEIAQIEVSDYIKDGKHAPKIVLPNGTIITEKSFMSQNASMDETLAKNVIQARALRDAGEFSENKRREDLPIEDIIVVYDYEENFAEYYKVSSDKNGNLVTEEVNRGVTNEQIETDEPEI